MAEAKKESYTFPKSEKLCSDKATDLLFAKGESFIAYPLRVVYRVDEDVEKYDSSVSVLVSVSKRKFKRAVKRNRVKRLIREAYRLNNKSLKEFFIHKPVHIDLAFLYLKDELPTYAEIEKAMLKALNLLQEKLDLNKSEANKE